MPLSTRVKGGDGFIGASELGAFKEEPSVLSARERELSFHQINRDRGVILVLPPIETNRSISVLQSRTFSLS